MTLPSGTIVAADLNTEFNAIYTTLTGENKTGLDYSVSVEATIASTQYFSEFISPDDLEVVSAIVSVFNTVGVGPLGILQLRDNAGLAIIGFNVSGAGAGEFSSRQSFTSVTADKVILQKGLQYTLMTSFANAARSIAVVTLRSRARNS